jgi:SAM-dependent methyltransferase
MRLFHAGKHVMPTAFLEPILQWGTLRQMRGRRFRRTFSQLEDAHSRFHAAQERIEKGGYDWPLQPLYEWSRRLEYPFVIEALRKNAGVRVLDAGSGVTFLPFFLREKFGMQVECLDFEPSYPERMKQVCDLLEIRPPFPFHVGDLTRPLPCADESFDSVLSISVLEHLERGSRLEAVARLWHLVRPGGQLVMTFDVSLSGEGEGIPLVELQPYLRSLSEIVGPLPTLDSRPPRNLLTPQNPGYGLAPVFFDKELVRGWYDSWQLKRRRLPLPYFKPLGLVLVCAPKEPARCREHAPVGLVGSNR